MYVRNVRVKKLRSGSGRGWGLGLENGVIRFSNFSSDAFYIMSCMHMCIYITYDRFCCERFRRKMIDIWGAHQLCAPRGQAKGVHASTTVT